MSNPVVHFEIGCQNQERTADYFSQLFGWKMQAMGPATMIDTGPDSGIQGHITALGHEPQRYTIFYVQVDDVQTYLDISGIPPKTLLKYFPRLEEIASKTLFGTDWPGPGVPDIKQNLDEFRALPLTQEIQDQILSKTALSIWPA